MRKTDGDELLLSASDLSAHLGCQHRTQLDRRAALGQIDAPPPDPMLAVLQERGLAHERAYVKHLEGERSTQKVELANAPLNTDGMEATRRAMVAGADIITHALVGILVRQGRLELDAPAPCSPGLTPESPGTPSRPR